MYFQVSKEEEGGAMRERGPFFLLVESLDAIPRADSIAAFICSSICQVILERGGRKEKGGGRGLRESDVISPKRFLVGLLDLKGR